METDMAQADQADRTFVVRVSLQTSAQDPADAVDKALERLLRAGLENFTYVVDDVGNGAKFFVTPSEYAEFLAALDRAWG
jgi:hypothetical protein